MSNFLSAIVSYTLAALALTVMTIRREDMSDE